LKDAVVADRGRPGLERLLGVEVTPHGDGVHPVNDRRVILRQREEVVARQEERGRVAHGDHVGARRAAENELDLADRCPSAERLQHDPLMPVSSDDGDLSRDDEVKTRRFLPLANQPFASLEHAQR